MTRPANQALLFVTAFALGLWLFNDHVAKATWPGWVTGKLSDVAGLIAFPAVLAWTVGLFRPAWQRSLLPVAAMATAAVFAATNVFPWAAAAYRAVLGSMTMDATDLATLPAVLVPVWLGLLGEPDLRGDGSCPRTTKP